MSERACCGMLVCWLVLSCAIVAGCERPQPAEPQAQSTPAATVEQAAVTPEATPTPAPGEAAAIDNPSEEYAAFVAMRSQEPLDCAALRQLYLDTLAGYVKEADQRNATALDAEITAALDQAAAGVRPHGNVQVADKLVQYAFVSTFINSMAELKAGANNDAVRHHLREAAPVVRSTAVRRSNWLGDDNLLPGAFDALWAQLESAIDSADVASLEQAGGQMRMLVIKLYVLSVLYELVGLEQARGTDATAAEEKKAEAQTFYRFISAEHKLRNANGQASVERQLAKQPEQIKIDLARRTLLQDFAKELAGVDPKLLGG